MAELRVLAATILFTISSYLIYDLFANGFNWLVLLAVITGYLLVHFIWPKYSSPEGAWYDALDLIFYFPYRCIALLVRSKGKVFHSGDGDIAFDL